MSSIAEPIWFEQPSILFENEKLTEFIPLGNMPFANKMNSMVRLSIYFSVLWFFYDFNNDALYIPLFIMLMTYLLYTHLQKCLPSAPTTHSDASLLLPLPVHRRVTVPSLLHLLQSFALSWQHCKAV